MKAAAPRLFQKNKLAQISLASVLVVAAIYGVVLSRSGGAKAASALCYGGAGTFTAVAPSTVTPGQNFNLTKITGFANTNIATVNTSTLTFAISGATPATASETWSGGPVHGDYTATYADLGLTATGGVGSQVTVSLTEIDAAVVIGTAHTTITCSVSNGGLTANNPGQSLVLATVNIVAPAAAPKSAASTSSSSANPKATTSTTPATATPAATAAPTNSTADSTNTTSDSSSTQEITVRVTNSQGGQVKGAMVVLDSLPAAYTDSNGMASFQSVGLGSHNLSITASGHTITQKIQAQSQNGGKVLGLQIKLPPPSHSRRNWLIGLVGSQIILLSAIVFFIRRALIRKRLAASQAAVVTPQATPLQTPTPVVPTSPVVPPTPSSLPPTDPNLPPTP